MMLFYNIELLWLLIPLLFIVCLVAVYYVWQARKTMAGLETMVDKAIDGDFKPEHYNESQLSRLEVKLWHFLNASSLSRKNLDADRARIKTLIGDISHQTKTPIANISLYAQLLQEQELPQEFNSWVTEISNQSQKLGFLIESMVKLSRLETGVIQVKPRKDSLSELLQTVAASYSEAALEKGVRFTVESANLEAYYDKKWTAEALGNLVDNAIKYTAAGGYVQVTAREYELFCRIDVRDNGLGIAEGEHAKIFARFYRGAAVANGPGVGVGLYLAREIALAQGGYIKVHSQVGHGSTFSLYLPKNQALDITKQRHVL